MTESVGVRAILIRIPSSIHENSVAFDPGRPHPRRSDLLGGPAERVPVEHDEIGHGARREDARVVAVVRPRAARGVRRERDLERQRLLGQERVACRPGPPRRTPCASRRCGSRPAGRASTPASRCPRPAARRRGAGRRTGTASAPAPPPGTGSSGRPSAGRASPRASAGWRRPRARRSAARPPGGRAAGARPGAAWPGRCRPSRRGSRGRRGRRWRARAPGTRPRRGHAPRPGALPRRRTSGRGCRSHGRTGRGTARASPPSRSRPRRPA